MYKLQGKVHAHDGKIVFLSESGESFVFFKGGKMGLIQCCGAMHKAQRFVLQPQDGYIEAYMDWLESCPCCSHTVIQLVRINYDNQKTIVRKINYKARKLRSSIESSILYEVKEKNRFTILCSGRFYLYYNDFGKKKKCFSNLSQLRLGLTENGCLIQKPVLRLRERVLGI